MPTANYRAYVIKRKRAALQQLLKFIMLYQKK